MTRPSKIDRTIVRVQLAASGVAVVVGRLLLAFDVDNLGLSLLLSGVAVAGWTVWLMDRSLSRAVRDSETEDQDDHREGATR